MAVLIAPKMTAIARHPHVDGYVDKHGMMMNLGLQPEGWITSDTELFSPLRGVILKRSFAKVDMALTDWDYNGSLIPKVRLVTPPSSPAKKYIKQYIQYTPFLDGMWLVRRTDLNVNPTFKVHFLRTRPSVATYDGLLHIAFGAENSPYVLGIPQRGADNGEDIYLMRLKEAFNWLNVQPPNMPNPVVPSDTLLLKRANDATLDAEEFTVTVTVIENIIFIEISTEPVEYFYGEPGLTIPAAPVRIGIFGLVGAFNFTPGSYSSTGFIQQRPGFGYWEHAAFATTSSFKYRATLPGGTSVVGSKATTSNVSIYKATLARGASVQTPILYGFTDAREPTFGAANVTTIDLGTLGALVSADWSEDDDGHSGRASIVIENVALAATLPKEGALLEITAGWQQDTGDDTALDWWGYVTSVRIEREAADQTLGVSRLVIEAETAAYRLGRQKCLFFDNFKTWNWADAFKYAGRRFGFPNSRMTEVTDSGKLINTNFICDEDWDGIQMLNELIKMRGGWVWGINHATGKIYAKPAVTSGASAFTIDENTVTDGDFIVDVGSDRNIDDRYNLLFARFTDPQVLNLPRTVFYQDKLSVSDDTRANFLGFVSMRYEEFQGNDRPDKALYDAATKLYAISPRILAWQTDGKRLHVGDLVTVQVTGVGISAGTQMRILRKESRVENSGNVFVSEFTCETLA